LARCCRSLLVRGLGNRVLTCARLLNALCVLQVSMRSDSYGS